MMKTLAAIPAWNQEMRVASIVHLTKGHVDAVLVINDGSNDRTAKLAEMAGAIVLNHDVNKGYGGALKSCFHYAKENGYDAMVILDSDGQHDPDQIPAVFRPVIDQSADISIGSRFLDSDVDVPRYRKVGIGVITKLTNTASGNGLAIKDSQSGFRAYSKRAIEAIEIFENDMGASVEILLQANKHGLKIAEVPISINYDEDSSSQNPVGHGLRVVGSIVRYMEFEHPLLVFGVTGFIMVCVSSILGAWSYYNYDQSGFLPFGPTILALLFMISGMLMGITGLILHAVISANHRLWGR